MCRDGLFSFVWKTNVLLWKQRQKTKSEIIVLIIIKKLYYIIINLVRNSHIKNSIKETLQRESQYNKPDWIN